MNTIKALVLATIAYFAYLALHEYLAPEFANAFAFGSIIFTIWEVSK